MVQRVFNVFLGFTTTKRVLGIGHSFTMLQQAGGLGSKPSFGYTGDINQLLSQPEYLPECT